MKVHKGYKFRLEPTEEQEVKINKTLGCCRFIYNSILDRRIKAYRRRGESMSYIDTQNLLPQMKTYLPWLAEADSQALKSCFIPRNDLGGFHSWSNFREPTGICRDSIQGRAACDSAKSFVIRFILEINGPVVAIAVIIPHVLQDDGTGIVVGNRLWLEALIELDVGFSRCIIGSTTCSTR